MAELYNQLMDLKAHCQSMIPKDEPDSIWHQDTKALSEAMEIIKVLEKYKIPASADELKNVLHDYMALGKQNSQFIKQYRTPAKPKRDSKLGIYLCPTCNHRISENHSHCHWCGQRIGGYGKCRK